MKYHTIIFKLYYRGRISDCIVQEICDHSFSILSWESLLLRYLVGGWQHIAVHRAGIAKESIYYLLNTAIAFLWDWK